MTLAVTTRRGNQLLFLFEVAAIAAIFFFDWQDILPFSKVPFLFLVAWTSLLLRGHRWKDVGFRIPPNWKQLVVVGLLVGIAMEALELFLTQPALTKLIGKGPDLSDLNFL